MIGKTLAIALTCTAQSAFALSCMPPDPVASYVQARDDERLYSAVIGKISVSGPIAEPKVSLTPNPDTDIPAADTKVTLKGRGLVRSGFDVDFEGEITLRLTCAAHWCAGAPDLEAESFIFFRYEGDEKIAEIGPCPTNFLPVADNDELRVTLCHRNGTCDTRF